MTPNIHWTDQIGGVNHATFVHRGGHVLLRDVPTDNKEEITARVSEWRNDLENVEAVTEAQIVEFVETLGFVHDEGFNPPLVAYKYNPEALSGAANEDSDVDPNGTELKDMKVADLRDLAEKLGIEDPAGKKKEELLPLVSEAIAAKKGADGQE